MSYHQKTSAVAHDLHVPYYRLISLIRYGLIDRPPKDTSGDYIWDAPHVEAAREAIESRPAGRRLRKEVIA